MKPDNGNGHEEPFRFHATLDLKSHPEGLTAEKVPKGVGAATAYLVISMSYPPDGSYSQYWDTFDGRTGKPLPDGDAFKAWILMAESLSKLDGLHPGQKALVSATIGAFRDAMSSEE